MTDTRVIIIDGQECSFTHSQETVATILEVAGTTTDKSILISNDGVKHDDPNELIDIVPGHTFSTEDCGDKTETDSGPTTFTVNGEVCTTTESSITVETIFRIAGPGAALDLNDLDHYFLEDVTTGVKYENLDDRVSISDGDNFIAIHVGSTPVA